MEGTSDPYAKRSSHAANGSSPIAQALACAALVAGGVLFARRIAAKSVQYSLHITDCRAIRGAITVHSRILQGCKQCPYVPLTSSIAFP
jgi:hypothetical protein